MFLHGTGRIFSEVSVVEVRLVVGMGFRWENMRLSMKVLCVHEMNNLPYSMSQHFGRKQLNLVALQKRGQTIHGSGRT